MCSWSAEGQYRMRVLWCLMSLAKEWAGPFQNGFNGPAEWKPECNVRTSVRWTKETFGVSTARLQRNDREEQSLGREERMRSRDSSRCL